MPFDFKKLIGKKISSRYAITGKLGQGAMGAVFRAIPFDDPLDEVAIKIIAASKRIDSEELLRFQKEAALMSQLNHPNIVSFYELGLLDVGYSTLFHGGYFIVMEIASGNDLKSILARESKKDLDFFFDIGIQLAQALDYTHGKNVVHRDIKPHNLIVSENFLSTSAYGLKILDFGIALLQEVTSSSGSMNDEEDHEVAGTPLYMSPEQAGTLANPVDHRTDLYSVGCVLYEILTGTPPFNGTSMKALNDAHAHATPKSILDFRPDIPEVINDLVLKLLAKKPEDRYQTAFGLQSDLAYLKTNLSGFINRQKHLELGAKDALTFVNSKIPFVARHDQRQGVIDGYLRLAKEGLRTHVVAISGEVGAGKSRLLSEIKNNLLIEKARFIGANFHEHENALPFNALANAFNEYLLRLIQHEEHEAEKLGIRLNSILGDAILLLTEVIPGLRPYVNEALVPNKLENEEETGFFTEASLALFKKAFSDFMRCLSDNDAPLVLAFDNLHKADQESLALIDNFLSFNTSTTSARVYLIFTFEPDSSLLNSEFTTFIGKFEKLKRRYAHYSLENFTQPQIQELLNQIFSHKILHGKQLSEDLARTTHGNPLATISAIKQLVANDLIFVGKSGQWKIEIDKLSRHQINIENIELSLAELHNYSELEQKTLKFAASIGMRFYFKMLQIPGFMSRDQIIALMSKAMADGLIIENSQGENDYKYGRAYAFSHKKVKIALLQDNDVQTANENHLKIALWLKDHFISENDSTIFSLAYHFGQATGTSDFPVEIAALTIRFNYLAAGRAFKAGAYFAAKGFFEVALKYAKQQNYKMALGQDISIADVVNGYADTLVKLQQYALARDLLQDVLAMHISLPEKVVAYQRLIDVNILYGYLSKAKSLSFKAFSEFSPKSNLQAVSTIISKLSHYKLQKIPREMGDIWKRLVKTLDYLVLKAKAKEEKFDIQHEVFNLKLLAFDTLWADDYSTATDILLSCLDQVKTMKVSARGLIRFLFRMAYYYYHRNKARETRKFLLLARHATYRLNDASLMSEYMFFASYFSYGTEDFKTLNKRANGLLADNENSLNQRLQAECYCWIAFTEILNLDFKACQFSELKFNHLVSVRNPLSAKMAAYLCFGYFLKGQNTDLITYSKRFVKNRQEAQARIHDPFALSVAVLKSFAEHEFTKCEKDLKGFLASILHVSPNSYSRSSWDFLIIFFVTITKLFGEATRKNVDYIVAPIFSYSRRSWLARLSPRLNPICLTLLENISKKNLTSIQERRDAIGENSYNIPLFDTLQIFHLLLAQLDEDLPMDAQNVGDHLKTLEQRGLHALTSCLEKAFLLNIYKYHKQKFALHKEEHSVSSKIQKHFFEASTHTSASSHTQIIISDSLRILSEKFRFDFSAVFTFIEENPDTLKNVFYQSGEENISDLSLVEKFLLPYTDINGPLLLPFHKITPPQENKNELDFKEVEINVAVPKFFSGSISGGPAQYMTIRAKTSQKESLDKTQIHVGKNNARSKTQDSVNTQTTQKIETSSNLTADRETQGRTQKPSEMLFSEDSETLKPNLQQDHEKHSKEWAANNAPPAKHGSTPQRYNLIFPLKQLGKNTGLVFLGGIGMKQSSEFFSYIEEVDVLTRNLGLVLGSNPKPILETPSETTPKFWLIEKHNIKHNSFDSHFICEAIGPKTLLAGYMLVGKKAGLTLLDELKFCLKSLNFSLISDAKNQSEYIRETIKVIMSQHKVIESDIFSLELALINDDDDWIRVVHFGNKHTILHAGKAHFTLIEESEIIDSVGRWIPITERTVTKDDSPILIISPSINRFDKDGILNNKEALNELLPPINTSLATRLLPKLTSNLSDIDNVFLIRIFPRSDKKSDDFKNAG